MFDFIKKLFKKEPQVEQIVEVEVKPKRKYKPRAPKAEVKVEEAVVEATQPAVIAQALADPIRPRVMTKQLVGGLAEAEPEVIAVKSPAKKKPAAKKPAVVVVEPVAEPVVVNSVAKKPENKPKAPQNKPPRGKNKK